jgi:hypothetical protein
MAPALPAPTVTPAARVAFALGHATVLALFAWAVLLLLRAFAGRAARSIAREPLVTALAGAAVAAPTGILWVVATRVGGAFALLAWVALMVLGPIAVLGDALVALGAGWWLVSLAGTDPEAAENAAVLAGSLAVATAWVVPVVGVVLGPALVAVGVGAATRSFLTRLGYRGTLAAD